LLPSAEGRVPSNVHLDLGKTFRACSDGRQAESEYGRAIAADETDSYTHKEIGLLYETQGQHDCAAFDLARGIQAGSATAKHCEGLGHAIAEIKGRHGASLETEGVLKSSEASMRCTDEAS
jgi:hypothetical protein